MLTFGLVRSKVCITYSRSSNNNKLPKATKNYQNFSAKDLNDQCIGTNTKHENKNTADEYKYFLELKFVGVNRLFVLLYTNKDDNTKRYKARRYYGKNVCDKLIFSDLKRQEEIQKLKTGQGEDYATRCFFGYDYIKNHYKIIAVDLSSLKGLDSDLKTIQQTEFVRKLRKTR